MLDFVSLVPRSGANKETTLIVSLLWIIYNMIPPYLLIHYTFIGRGSTLNFMSKCAISTYDPTRPHAAVVSTSSTPTATQGWLAAPSNPR